MVNDVDYCTSILGRRLLVATKAVKNGTPKMRLEELIRDA